MKQSILLLALIVILFSCKQTTKEKSVQQPDQYKVEKDSLPVKKFPPLTEEEITLSDDDFGEIIELKGTTHPVNQFFKVSECEMIALDSILIVKNLNNSDMLMAYSLPSFDFIKSFGKRGRGPGEFQFPKLIKDDSGESLCFIYERTKDKLYALNKDFEINELPIEFQEGEKNFNDKQLYGISSKEFLYVESINRGKAIFRIVSKNDSINTNQLKNLAFSDKHKNWAAYIGDFGANGKMKRAVFAYKNFKRLVFFDFENNTSKVVSFDESEMSKKGDVVSTMAPSNITHYWGMSSENEHVYVLYSGRSPIEVSKDLNESSGYIYLEKFDWSGNPISKYKLDHWGYFCVNEKENTIYLASVTDEQPFISYKLPE